MEECGKCALAVGEGSQKTGKKGGKGREIFESLGFWGFFWFWFFCVFWGRVWGCFLFFLFLHALVFSCIFLIQIPLSKMVHIILQKWRNGPHHPNTGETGVSPTAVPGPLQMFASCCSEAIQERQLIQPCSAGLQCSAEGAGNATNGDK